MAEDLRIGEVVVLMGQGIEMTIVDDSVQSSGIFGCAWYDNNSVLQIYNFKKDVLERKVG